MNALFASFLVGAGLGLLVLGQPFGRPRMHLRELLRRRTGAAWAELRPRALEDDAAPPLDLPFIGRLLARPLLRAGRAIDQGMRSRGIGDSDALAQHLVETQSDLTVAAFRGRQLLMACAGTGVLPVLNLIGFTPFGSWPWLLWAVFGVAGWFLPSFQLRRKRAARHEALLGEVLPFIDLLTLYVSAGQTMDTAIGHAGQVFGGPLGQEMRHMAIEAETSGRPFHESLAALAEAAQIRALQQVSLAWNNFQRYGTPVSDPLRHVAQTLRQQETLDIVERAARANVAIMLPLGGLIFPATLLVVLFPIGRTLFGALGSL